MQHLDEGTIHAWLDGELPLSEREAAEAHVDACAQCAMAVGEARGFIAAASRILTALDTVPGGVLPAKGSAGAASTGARKRFTLSRAWMAAAAVLVLSTVTVIARRPGQNDKLATAVFQDELKSMHAETQSEAPVAGAPAATATPVPQEKAPMSARAQEPRAGAGGAASGAASGAADKSDARAQVARKDARQKKETNDGPPGNLADATLAAAAASAKPSTPASSPAERPFAREADALVAKSSANEKLGSPSADSIARDSAPQLVSRNSSRSAGDTVVTTVYSVRGVAVSLIDRSRARDESGRIQVRGMMSQSAAKVRNATAPENSISWSDSSGHTRTLRGALSREALERIRTALFGSTP